jgi:hypothetical protein
MQSRDAGNEMQGCGECDVGMRWDVNGMREGECGWQNATARMHGMQHRDAGNADAECGCRGCNAGMRGKQMAKSRMAKLYGAYGGGTISHQPMQDPKV